MRIAPLLLLAACSAAPSVGATPPPDMTAPDAGSNQPVDPPPSCPDAAGTLTIYAIPPPVSLDWSTPNKLLNSVIASKIAAGQLVKNGEAAITHSIGHVNVQLDCGDLSIPLTGQTDQGGGEWQAATDGAGLLLRDTPGVMDAMPDGDPDDTIADIAARQTHGHVSEISFTVNQAMCQRLKSFVDAYQAAGAYEHYDGASRARRMEGAGCAIFGAGVIDVGGLLHRSQFTPVWSRSEMIGSARIGNFLGASTYRYGGNLVAVDEAGTHWVWPKGQDVPAQASPIVFDSSVLDAWNGPEDQPFSLSGLSGAMTNQLPFSIYDPQLMAEWADQVFAQALSNGSASALGVTWTASLDNGAHRVTADAHCTAPQTIGFTEDNDDLFADSDAP